MKLNILFILINISTVCFSQQEKTAEIINIRGTILYKYIPDETFNNYYCSLGTTIIIDSTEYDFVPENDANNQIIRKNKSLSSTLGTPEEYLTGNFETNLYVLRSSDTLSKSQYCDSILKVYSKNNIYDSILFKPTLNELMAYKITSRSLFSKNNSDTTIIALSFTGTVIKYSNIIYGNQNDTRLDDQHGTCPFIKIDQTFIVLNKVDNITKISEKDMDLLNLKKIDLKIISL